ncbi:rhodanese-like domain-containing protein [Pontibacter chitinilyticus]|uniref:rhodanese-like domain-containing protein n=1 Tax=Pontibacter chitinilyticus TaxID=2674989 RepID=UPI00321BFBE8
MMKVIKHTFISCLTALLFVLAAPASEAQTLPKPQQPNPWTAAELLEPAILARNLQDANQKNDPLILNIGFVNNIKGAVAIGAASTEEGRQALKDYLKKVPADQEVVIYCGCCPFEKCPNVRPAFAYLKELGYTHARLLNLKDNLKTNWISKGYPMAE